MSSTLPSKGKALLAGALGSNPATKSICATRERFFQWFLQFQRLIALRTSGNSDASDILIWVQTCENGYRSERTSRSSTAARTFQHDHTIAVAFSIDRRDDIQRHHVCPCSDPEPRPAHLSFESTTNRFYHHQQFPSYLLTSTPRRVFALPPLHVRPTAAAETAFDSTNIGASRLGCQRLTFFILLNSL
jgi:hypothetical protein